MAYNLFSLFTVPFQGRERKSEVPAGARITGKVCLTFFLSGGILHDRWLVTTAGCALSVRVDLSTTTTPYAASRSSQLRVLLIKLYHQTRTPNSHTWYQSRLLILRYEKRAEQDHQYLVPGITRARNDVHLYCHPAWRATTMAVTTTINSNVLTTVDTACDVLVSGTYTRTLRLRRGRQQTGLIASKINHIRKHARTLEMTS